LTWDFENANAVGGGDRYLANLPNLGLDRIGGENNEWKVSCNTSHSLMAMGTYIREDGHAADPG